MQGFFIVSSNESEEFDIKCSPHPQYAKEDVPDEQQKLYVEIENANNIIKSLHNTKDNIKKKYFNKLLSLAQAGLVGETAQPALSSKSLIKLKDEIVLIEGKRIKNYYMKKLGLISSGFCTFFVVLYFVFQQFEVLCHFSMYCLAIIGASIGTWISFGARKFNIKFEQLSLIEEDMMEPLIRLLYISVCSAIIMLLLNTQLISIGVGKISTVAIKDSCEIQLSIGVLCGLIESKIGINIYKKAVNILSDE